MNATGETLRQKRTRLRLAVLEIDKQLARPGHRVNPETERMYTSHEYQAWRQKQVMAKADLARQLVQLKEQLADGAQFWQVQAGSLSRCLVAVESWSRREPDSVVHGLVRQELDRYGDACAEHKRLEEGS